MPLSNEQKADLTAYEQLSTHLVKVLDGEAAIESADRLLSPTNITNINTTYTNLLSNIDLILATQVTPP